MESSTALTLVDWMTLIGIPSIIAGLLYIGGKLQVLNQLDIDMRKIKHNVSVIANALIASDNVEFNHELLQACSPIQLTEKGNNFLEEIGFKELYGNHSDDFIKCINDDAPQTDYDIENAAIKCVYFLFDKPYFNEIKDYLYNNPKEDKKELMKIAGIYVRDKYQEWKNANIQN